MLDSFKSGQKFGSVGNLKSGFMSGGIAPFDKTKLLCYYKFDEASGNILNKATAVGSTDSMSTADLTVVGCTYRATGIIDFALSYDGINDTASASNTTTSQWGFTNKTGAEFTFIIWYIRDGAGTHTLMATTDFPPAQTGILLQIRVGREIRIICGKDGVDKFLFATSMVTPDDTNWHMLMVKYSDSSGIVAISIDNNTPETSSGHNLTNTTNSETIMNFGSDGQGNNFLAGDLDELSIWNRILTADEITRLFNSGNAFAL